MNLSHRLQKIADMVTPGYTVADIGTDHAYLPIELVSTGKCPSAIAMDIKDGPLRIAQKHIEEHGLEDKIICRLSDGLQQLKNHEVRCAVISGMGGDLISRIISDDPDKAEELIISPHTHYESVRKCLRNNHYSITDEDMLVDSGKYYLIIKAVKEEKELTHDDTDCDDYFGRILIERKNSCLKEYLLKEKAKFLNIPQKSEYLKIVDMAINRIYEEN
ncbi:MAG: class I SAM-dependent methyltransferase [Lachnospiraceae bacterium]|nr:class I SAM-dependent methyltransferase [Lachnospiraceae bacterium]